MNEDYNVEDQEVEQGTPELELDNDFQEEDGFFDDIDVEEEATEIEQEDHTEEQEDAPFLKIKYNHEEMGLSQEEAAALAQKGMNYDKLYEKYNSTANDPAIQYINEIAQRNGMSLTELTEYWRNQEEQNEIESLVEQDIPEEYAREMLENRKFREQMQRQQHEAQEQERQSAEFRDFFNAFPGVDPKDIPAEVWQKNTEGIPLKYAYMEHHYKNINTQNSILKNNQANKRKAPGLGVTSHGSKATKGGDPFLDGFNEDF